MLLIALLIQAAPAADVEVSARATVREVRIRQSGETSLEVRGGPGSDVRVEAPRTDGRRRLRNVTVSVHAEARIADPAANRRPAETPEPQ